ncbi:MAG: hypothetical protein LBJ77_01925 [Holosporales bacterium]|jgi:hypothetical protein|nr:hypothetical protein [Holosporales bacterium]
MRSIERLSILTRLILEFEKDIRLLEAIRYAKDLAAVIDELRAFNIDLSQFRQEFTLFFAEHWKRRTNLLLIVTDFWPQILKELGKEDVILPSPHRLHPSVLEPKIPQNINIFEADDIFHELEFIDSIVNQNKNKRIAIISPDKNIFTLLCFKLKLDNPKKNENLDEIAKYFGDMVPENSNEFRKIISELSVVDNISVNRLELADNIGSIINRPSFDIVICTSMNDGSWFPVVCGEYWLHQSIRQKIGMPTRSTLRQQMEDDFYDLIGASDEVFLTRSQRINKSEARKSSILAKLEMRCKKAKLPINYCEKDKSFNSVTKTDPPRITNFIIPKRLSAGGLRLLMQNPYGFYARYSLGIESTDSNKKIAERANAFRELIRIYLHHDDDLNQHLELIKQIDFFYYQQCLGIIDWMQSNYRQSTGFWDILGRTNLGDSDIELTGGIDIIEDRGDHALASYFQAFSPASTHELLYGADCAILATCLIAEKNGFPEMKLPIREIRIYWPSPKNELSPFSVKNLEISGELIKDFEVRVCNLIDRFSEMNNLSHKNSSYWHLERREK